MSKTFRAITENKNLWKGLGTQYTSISQVLDEFIDNSISNFIGNPTLSSNSIIITLEELDTSRVKISIEDSGTGIRDFANAFGLGAKSAQDSPFNEHGFGMKQALAAADPSNSTWRLCTRISEDSATYDEVAAPYFFDKDMVVNDSKTDWPGQLSATGTYIEFVCTRDFFKTVSRGLKGDYSKFDTLSALLYEDLGFTYAGIISSKSMDISVSIKIRVIEFGKTAAVYSLGALLPKENRVYAPGKGDEKVSYDKAKNEYIVDPNGNIKIHYEFLEIDEKPEAVNFENTTSRKYYKANMSTSGIEIRFNGRVMKYNVFGDVWNTEKHNSYNSLLVIIDLITNDASNLPGTTTSKNGLNEGDEKLEALYKWIRRKMPNPIKSLSKSTSERELFRTLKENKEKAYIHSSVKPTISVEQRVWKIISTDEKRRPRIDLYESILSDVNIYEGKYNKTDSQDVYQLKMYWDGLISDGTTPTCGILVADEHPDWVKKLVKEVNGLKDSNGNYYNFVFDTWENLGVK